MCRLSSARGRPHAVSIDSRSSLPPALANAEFLFVFLWSY